MASSLRDAEPHYQLLGIPKSCLPHFQLLGILSQMDSSGHIEQFGFMNQIRHVSGRRDHRDAAHHHVT